MISILRPQLFQTYNRNPNWKITIIQAPMGSGKSFLLKEWQKYYQEDPDCFAFPVICPSSPEDAASALATIQAQIAQTRDWQNENPDIRQSFLLIDDCDIFLQANLARQFFDSIRMSPITCHFILAGTAFANLLHYSLVDKTMHHLPVNQLMLTRDESRAFMRSQLGTNLSETDIDHLHTITEGWPLGLRFAAQSYQQYLGSYQLSEFNGSDDYVDKFFSHFVFDELPEDLKRFSLATALCEKLNASLCCAITGRADDQNKLEELAGCNPFLYKMNTHGAYQYNRLYANWLQRQTMRINASELRTLATRAGRWYLENGSQANEAEMMILATDSRALIPLLNGSFLAGQIRNYASLCTYVLTPAGAASHEHNIGIAILATWAAIGFGRLESIEAYSAFLQQYMTKLTPGNRATYKYDPILHSIAEATIHGIVHHNQSSIKLCEELLSSVSLNSNPMAEFHLDYTLADAYERTGELSQAADYCLRAYACAMAAGAVDSATFPNYKKCKLLLAQGRFAEIERTCNDSLTLANPDSPLRKAFLLLRALVKIEGLDLEDAQINYSAGISDLTPTINPEIYIEAMIVKSELLVAREKFDQAYEELLQTVLLFADTQIPAAAMSFVYIAIGRVAILRKSASGLKEAIAWLVPVTSAEDKHHSLYLRYFQVILAYFVGNSGDGQKSDMAAAAPTASLNQSNHKLRELDEYLEELRAIAHQASNLTYNTLFIECKMAEAQILLRHARRELALQAILPALEVGQRGKYRLTIINCGEPVYQLLLEICGRADLTNGKAETTLVANSDNAQLLDYLRTTLQLFYTRNTSSAGDSSTLTAREQEVLRMLNAGKTRAEISESLFISINTTKAHIRSIHRKLGER